MMNSFKVLVVIVSFVCSQAAQGNELKSLFQCGDGLISDEISNDSFIVIDSYLGFKKFLKYKLSKKNYSLLMNTSRKFLSTSYTEKRKPLSSTKVVDLFSFLLQNELVTRMGLSFKDNPDNCSNEVFRIAEQLHKNKYFNIYNEGFRNFFKFHGLTLASRSEENRIYLLAFLSSDFLTEQTGICKTYTQKSESYDSEVTLCN